MCCEELQSSIDCGEADVACNGVFVCVVGKRAQDVLVVVFLPHLVAFEEFHPTEL